MYSAFCKDDENFGLFLLSDIPNVQTLQTQYTVDFAGTVILECSITSNPAHTLVYWKKVKNGMVTEIDAATINSDPRLSGSTVNVPSLTITNTNVNDTAVYVCFASNSVGTGQSKQINLSVSGGKTEINRSSKYIYI